MKKLKFLCMIAVLSCMYMYADQDKSVVAFEMAGEGQIQLQENDDRLEQKIQLFMYQNCPYCTKVLLFLYNNDLLDQVEIIDAAICENRYLLQQLSGKTQVPYLVDRQADIKMAESLDIIAYIAKKFNKQAHQQHEIIKLDGKLSSLDDQEIYHEASFFSNIKQSTKPIVILVSTTWCPPCKQFKPIFKEVAQELQDVCEFIILDGDLNSFIRDQLQINCYPTVVCFKNGQKINPENYRTKDGLLKVIANLL